MLKTLFSSPAGYLIAITILGGIVTVVGWTIYWMKKIKEERTGS
jgi:hypothetical protein